MPSLLAFSLISVLALGTASALPGTITTLPPAATITNAPRALSTPTTSPLPLTDYTYSYSDIPYQVNPYAVGRGPQSGYNECNSTTEGPNAECQTAIVNSAGVCLWGSPTADGLIGNVEAAVVAYCTRSGHGARIMPAGTITAVQFMKTPGYIQVVGLLNQTGVDLASNDTGGELDPHGDDDLGNPVGGLVYSTGLPSGDNVTYIQVTSWNNFVGSGEFCFKLCDPSYSTDLNYCQNIYDLLGCAYNAPAAYTPNVFESCEGDLQDEVGTYTSDGATYTYSQPSVLGDATLPWTPRIPASSNCVTYQSSDLFPNSLLGYQSSAVATSSASSAVRTGSTGSSGASSGASSSASRTGSSSSSGASATATKASGAASSGVHSLAAVAFAALFGALLV